MPSPPPPPPSILDLTNKVSPSILLIIVILAIIFFISGLLHLLVRFLMRPPNRGPNEYDINDTAFQGQLQQLFNLHDSGVDQSFIDTLPVFNYKAITDVKNSFDCAVCLCEFESDDNLRLLPKCSHAFHMECIDTWLLSHSTCPLCRASLISDFSQINICSSIVLVLESGSSESSREPVSDREGILGVHNNEELADLSHKSCEIRSKMEENQQGNVGLGEKVVHVKLGKFKNIDGGGEGSICNVDGRRCFSMGSFEYVMDDNSTLQVPIITLIKKQSRKRPAISESGSYSTREFNGNFEGFTNIEIDNGNGDGGIGRSKRESFSVSKIWLRGKEERPDSTVESSRRAFSFRLPLHRRS